MVRVTDFEINWDTSGLCLKSVSTPAGKLVFGEPLELRRTESGRVVVLDIPALRPGAVGVGRSMDKALLSLCRELAWLWWEYAQAPDESLSADARDLARRLRQAAELVARPAPRLQAEALGSGGSAASR